MSTPQHFKYSNNIIIYPLLILFANWLVFWYQVRIDSGIRAYGIRPQKLEGLIGVVTSPFLHGDIHHIYNNSIPLFVLTVALFYFYNKIAWKVIGFGILLSGFMTWFIASSGNHIGASGLVYVLVSFMFFKGIFAKHYRLIALSLVVIFLYGSMIWYVFPIKSGMSWEGHLSGLITGLVFALIFRKQVAKPERYTWEEPDYNEEEDPFMKHFDENGNFIEFEPEVETENETESEIESKLNRAPSINYIYKKKED
ncbi:rhomboid family intramembrane serine protease [Winogradskyella sediminis]|uniref:Membrane associated serine protease, rhomboid family n=1 Tax=Winogradskyella sediminis TaxID=1382466 RepID=A0A1H1UIR8_9FLAO|nr:rhomboid family intramembrane serine protease [Winogradskyella sediminis]REG85228.1 membrane associated rhomboid family serine protease [Winogradskyella sediminis]SDS72240.1 Membrane associated serine protease, rhomboid family [Winogradskyella sediminis]